MSGSENLAHLSSYRPGEPESSAQSANSNQGVALDQIRL
jgi:hypothetical protein